MGIRYFTRVTNELSKKIENHAAEVALWFGYYNFCRMHQTLRVTPAMEAGITDTSGVCPRCRYRTDATSYYQRGTPIPEQEA
jgi:hypothetical protein